jgi:hypothetical protein
MEWIAHAMWFSMVDPGGGNIAVALSTSACKIECSRSKVSCHCQKFSVLFLPE